MHKVLRLKKDTELRPGLKFTKGTEFELLNNVVYMHGVPLKLDTQEVIFNWIRLNPGLFVNDTRH